MKRVPCVRGCVCAPACPQSRRLALLAGTCLQPHLYFSPFPSQTFPFWCFWAFIVNSVTKTRQ